MKPRVLLADDDTSVRESLRKLLQAEGYQVVLAANGAEAVEKFHSTPTPIDLALLDLNMPFKNGWATLDRLVEANPRLPVMVLTGLPNQDALAEAAGVSALVEKPMNVPALLQLMQAILAESAQVHLPGPGRWEFLFHHLRAAGRDPPSLRTNPHTDAYAHGGINE